MNISEIIVIINKIEDKQKDLVVFLRPTTKGENIFGQNLARLLREDEIVAYSKDLRYAIRLLIDEYKKLEKEKQEYLSLEVILPGNSSVQ